MLKMTRNIIIFLLASAIVLYARRSHAMVPRPLEELLAMLSDKYGSDIVERNVETNDSGSLYFLIV